MDLTNIDITDKLPWRQAAAAVELINAATRPHVILKLRLDQPIRSGEAIANLTWQRELKGQWIETAEIRLRSGSVFETIGAEEGVVWVLRRASTKQRASLRERGISYVDLMNRTVNVILRGLLVFHDKVDWAGFQGANRETRRSIDPFSDGSSRVVRVLLQNALTDSEPRSWGVRELAVEAGVNRTSTSEIVRYLAKANALELRQRGRASDVRLSDPVRLIEMWSRRYDYTNNGALTVHAPVGSAARFMQRLPDYLRKTRWALTLQAAASTLAPHASWDKAHVYLDVASNEDLYDVAAEHQWNPGEDGNLVLMRPFYRTSVWHAMRMVNSLPVVGLPQLLVDLWRYPVRGREQAEHLIDVQKRAAASDIRTLS